MVIGRPFVIVCRELLQCVPQGLEKSRWSGPRGVGGWILRSPRRTVANRFSRILNSLQIFMICRSVVITLVRSGGPSEHFRHDLAVPLLLKQSRGFAR
jgi:hypothetical protein